MKVETRQIISWATGIVLTLALAGASIFFAQTYSRFKANLQKRAQVERELSKLQTELHRIQSNPQKVRRWKQILSRVHAAGLDADNWLLYPLDIDQKLSWAQVEGLVYLVSRGRPYPQDYWFKPELFVLIKIAASKQKANDQHLRAQVTDSEKDMYQIKLKGQFLMRKRMFQ